VYKYYYITEEIEEVPELFRIFLMSCVICNGKVFPMNMVVIFHTRIQTVY